MSNQFFSIDVDNRALTRFSDRLSDFSGIAENDATKRSIKALERYLINESKKKFNLKVSRIRSSMKVQARNGRLTISGRAPTLFQFLTPGQQRKLSGGMYRDPKKKGLAIRYFKDRGRSIVPGTFLIRGRGGNPLVVRRKQRNNPNSKLEALYGRWTRDLWEIKEVRSKSFSEAREKFTERYISTFDKLKKGII